MVASARKLIGATNPLAAEPGTIRGDLAVEVGRNVVHGSDSPENGERETGEEGRNHADQRLESREASNSRWWAPRCCLLCAQRSGSRTASSPGTRPCTPGCTSRVIEGLSSSCLLCRPPPGLIFPRVVPLGRCSTAPATGTAAERTPLPHPRCRATSPGSRSRAGPEMVYGQADGPTTGRPHWVGANSHRHACTHTRILTFTALRITPRAPPFLPAPLVPLASRCAGARQQPVRGRTFCEHLQQENKQHCSSTWTSSDGLGARRWRSPPL